MAVRVMPRPSGEDAGLTLVELIVALGLFTLFLSILVGGIVGFTRATTDARIDAQTSSAVGAAMKRVDKSVRYANAVNYPVVVSGKTYVEWQTDAVSAPSGVTTCTQLRYTAATGTIALRTWVAGAAASTGTWNVILSNIRGAATATYPFQVISAGANSNYQGLVMSVVTGPAAAAGTTTSSTVYAKNSSSNSTSNTVNGSGESQNPVCKTSDYHP